MYSWQLRGSDGCDMAGLKVIWSHFVSLTVGLSTFVMRLFSLITIGALPSLKGINEKTS